LFELIAQKLLIEASGSCAFETIWAPKVIMMVRDKEDESGKNGEREC
jgi:hypothetical protein